MSLINQIIPAIIAKDQTELNNQVQKLPPSIDTIQLDILDNTFIHNTSLNFEFSCPSQFICEAHLMIDDPYKWIKANHTKIDTVLIHYESPCDISSAISLAISKNLKVGIAVSPQTSIHSIIPFINSISQLLILTVTPGFYGGKFIPSIINKISQARHLFPNLDIEVDGSITPDTIKLCKVAGANMFVSGSYILNSPNSLQSINTLRSLIE